jgi:hypothetical protein
MKTIVIMGNGPSLKNIDLYKLKKFDTFGLNTAYRIYEKNNFYPTYFGSFDCGINLNYKNSFENLINSDNSIQKYFFIGTDEKKQLIFDEKIRTNPKFQKINFKSGLVKLSKSFLDFNEIGSSGANAAQVAILLGYERILLLGCDCNYYKTDGMEIYGPEMKIIKQIENNPNSWFDEYHQVGDKFWTPKKEQFQLPSWKILKEIAPNNIEIINCSEFSSIPYFKKEPFENFI